MNKQQQIQGPAIFLAQFVNDFPAAAEAEAGCLQRLQQMVGWAASLGYRGVQVPTK